MKIMDILLEKAKSYKNELAEIDYKLQAPEIVADYTETKMLSKKRKICAEIMNLLDRLESVVQAENECQKEIDGLDEENRTFFKEMREELSREESSLTLKLLAMFLNPIDEIDELTVEIKSPPEDAFFQEKLLRMYANFATLNGFESKRDNNLLFVKGANAFMYFQSATALHKWIDKKTAVCEVRVFKTLQPKKIEIAPDDVRVDIFLSHGKGGQNINKVETAIRLVHFATGIIVTCQDERSQLKNKERAFARLKEILQQKENDRVKLEESAQSNKLNEEMRKNQRKFFVSESTFTDLRAESKIDLNIALKGNINDLVEEILLKCLDKNK